MLAQYETNLKYRKRDENGDYVFGHGDADFLYGIDAMKQVILTRLHAFRGEWWEGDDTALPYFPDILGAPASARNKDTIDLMIIDRIIDTRGVISVSDIHSSIVNRQYSFACTVKTVYGDTTVEVST